MEFILCCPTCNTTEVDVITSHRDGQPPVTYVKCADTTCAEADSLQRFKVPRCSQCRFPVYDLRGIYKPGSVDYSRWSVWCKRCSSENNKI